MTSKAIACALAWQLAIPAAPLVAGGSRQASGDVPWIEGTLVGVDTSQRSVSYRTATGDVRTAAVGSDAALKKLSGWKMGQKVKLKCRQTDESSMIVEEAKKRGGWPWWAWVLTGVATAGVALVILGLTVEVV